MRYWKYLIFASFFVSMAVACNKKDPTLPSNGLYSGSFSRIYNLADTIGKGAVYFSLSEESAGYVLRGDTLTGAPYGCYGRYDLLGGNKIKFTNKAMITHPVVDPYFILDTVYTYTFSDASFFLSLTVDTVRYEYTLNRF